MPATENFVPVSAFCSVEQPHLREVIIINPFLFLFSARDKPRDSVTDVMVRWFCILFGNQFTPDEVYDGYPVDRMMHDIALALMAVQTQTTEILNEFPTKAAKTETATAESV